MCSRIPDSRQCGHNMTYGARLSDRDARASRPRLLLPPPPRKLSTTGASRPSPPPHSRRLPSLYPRGASSPCWLEQLRHIHGTPAHWQAPEPLSCVATPCMCMYSPRSTCMESEWTKSTTTGPPTPPHTPLWTYYRSSPVTPSTTAPIK